MSGGCVPEPECVRGADCPDGWICLANTCVAPPECLADADCSLDELCVAEACECISATGTRGLGQACSAAGQCCSNACVGAEGRGVCTRPCSSMADCRDPGAPIDMICGRIGGSSFCAPADFLAPCTDPGECSGGLCLGRIHPAGFVQRRCSWTCTTTADCPPDATCGRLETNQGFVTACLPLGDVCDGRNGGVNCESELCLGFDEPGEPDRCTSECDPEGGRPCAEGWGCAVVDPSFPRICVPGVP